MTFRLRVICATSIAALAFPIAGCGGDDAKDEAAEKYCKAVAEELENASESLDKCVDEVKDFSSDDAEEIERKLKEANEDLDKLPDDIQDDLDKLKKSGDGE